MWLHNSTAPYPPTPNKKRDSKKEVLVPATKPQVLQCSGVWDIAGGSIMIAEYKVYILLGMWFGYSTDMYFFYSQYDDGLASCQGNHPKSHPQDMMLK